MVTARPGMSPRMHFGSKPCLTTSVDFLGCCWMCLLWPGGRGKVKYKAAEQGTIYKNVIFIYFWDRTTVIVEVLSNGCLTFTYVAKNFDNFTMIVKNSN